MLKVPVATPVPVPVPQPYPVYVKDHTYHGHGYHPQYPHAKSYKTVESAEDEEEADFSASSEDEGSL